MEPAASRDRRSQTLLVLVGFLVMLSGLIGFYFTRPAPAAKDAMREGFDLSQVAAPPRVVVTASAAAAVPAETVSPRPLLGSMKEDLTGPAAAAAAASRPGSASAPGAAAGAAADQRREEAEFLARHGEELRRYEGRLGRITTRYYRENPAVRAVDADFARMERYMAIKRRYERDGDPFNFVRDSIALPEVRAEVARKMADVEVWKAAFHMMNDALKDPPPPAIYQQTQKFMLADPVMGDYVKEMTQTVTKNADVMVQGIPPGMDMTPIQKVVKDVSPYAMPQSAVAPGAAKP